MSFSLLHSRGALYMRKIGIVTMVMPKSSHYELLPSSFKKLRTAIDSFKCPRAMGSPRSQVPAKFKCGRPSTPNGELSKSGIRINGGDPYGGGSNHQVYKAAAINTAHHQSCFGRSKPTKSTQEWHSRWVEDRKCWGLPKSVRLCLKSIRLNCIFTKCFRNKDIPGIRSRIVIFASEHQSNWFSRKF